MSDLDIQALIKNQRKEASYVDAKYTVVVSGAGVKNEEKPPLEALLPGVRLHFLRYAMFEKAEVAKSDGKGKSNRYGAIRMEDKSDEEFTVSDAEASNNDIASTNNFMVAKAIPRKGYIYLINPKDDTDCHELEIGEDGRMSHIIWDKENFYPDKNIPKDKRKPEKTENLHYKLIINNSEDNSAVRNFWVSYSPVQWSYDMFVNVLGINDQQRKDRGMVFVNTSGIKKGEETKNEHIVPYKKLVFAYDTQNEGYHRNYLKRFEQVHAIEKAEEKTGKNEVYEDMFVTLHDPVGAAQDIKKELLAKNGEFTALVESIHTGETQEKALRRLANGMGRPEIDDEYRAMVSLALTCYNMVYTKQKVDESRFKTTPRNGRGRAARNRTIYRMAYPNMKYDGGVQAWSPNKPRDYKKGSRQRARTGAFNPDRDWNSKGGLDRSKLEGILGVDVRAYKRQAVIEFRDELGNFIKSKYFRGTLDFYLGSNECKIHGADLMYDILNILNTNPYDLDKILSLPQDYKAENKWQQFVYSFFNQPDDITFSDGEVKSIMPKYNDLSTLPALINTDTNFNLNQALSAKEDIVNKGAAALEKLIRLVTETLPKGVTKVNGKIVQEVSKKLEVVVDRLNKRGKTPDGKDAFIFKNNQIYLQLEAQAARLDVKDGFILAGAPKEGWTTILKEGSEVKHLHTDRTGVNSHLSGKKRKGKLVRAKHTMEVPAIQNQTITLKAKVQFQLQNLVEGKAFTGALAVLQVFNMKAALASLTDDFSGKNFIGSVGVGFELREAYKGFQIALLKNYADDLTIKSLGSQASKAGLYANAITTIICGIDTFSAIDRRDTDAAVAFGLATLAYGTATVASTGAGAAVLGVAAGGPVVWIAVGIGFGMVLLAHLLTDTEAETYFKNFLLSEHCKKYYRPKTKDYDPSAYTKLLISKKKELVDDEDYEKTLMNPQDAEAQLFDITTCQAMSFDPQGKKKTTFSGGEFDVAYTTLKAESFIVRIRFNHFFQSIDQAEYGALIFKDNETDAEFLDISQIYEAYKEDDELVLKINIPRKHRKYTCQLMVVVRLVIDDDEDMYFPYNMVNKKDRWLGARVPVNFAAGVFIPDSFMTSEAVQFDTLDRLQNVGNWQSWLERWWNNTEKDE